MGSRLVSQLETSVAFLSWRFSLIGGLKLKQELSEAKLNLRRARLGRSLIDHSCK